MSRDLTINNQVSYTDHNDRTDHSHYSNNSSNNSNHNGSYSNRSSNRGSSKNSRNRRQGSGSRWLFGAPFWLLLLVLAIGLRTRIVLSGGHRGTADEAALANGTAYLNTLNSKDPSRVEEVIKERRAAKMAAEKEQRIQDMVSGATSVWSLFEDYAFMGDSRTVGLYTWEFLPRARVIAASGATVRYTLEHLEEVKQLNPSWLILCYGLNDVSIGFWPTPESYATEYKSILDRVQQELPDTKIFVNSIFPAKDPAFEKSAVWRNIPEYSAALRTMCEGTAYTFIDNDPLAAEHMDLYEVDGIHFYRNMYDLWATNMITTIYRSLDDV